MNYSIPRELPTYRYWILKLQPQAVQRNSLISRHLNGRLSNNTFAFSSYLFHIIMLKHHSAFMLAQFLSVLMKEIREYNLSSVSIFVNYVLFSWHYNFFSGTFFVCFSLFVAFESVLSPGDYFFTYFQGRGSEYYVSYFLSNQRLKNSEIMAKFCIITCLAGSPWISKI